MVVGGWGARTHIRDTHTHTHTWTHQADAALAGGAGLRAGGRRRSAATRTDGHTAMRAAKPVSA